MTPFDLYKMQCCGLMDSLEVHQNKVDAAREDLLSLKCNGYSPDFYIDDVLHYHNLAYNSLTKQEIDYILGKI